MRRGAVVEPLDVDALIAGRARHSYTRELLAASVGR
jgi:ABC-type oligopeptide transport system ATPase subunit